MVRYTQNYLQKLENILEENNYSIRNERGNFKSGYCILQDKRVIVVNKFATLESRINALLEILKELNSKEQLNDEAMLELSAVLKSTGKTAAT